MSKTPSILDEAEEIGEEAQEVAYESATTAEAQIIRETALEALTGFWMPAMRFIRCYGGSKAFALDCFFFALGKLPPVCLPNGNPVETFEDLALIHRTTKQAVNQCVMKMQRTLKLPIMPNQRSKSGRRTMSDNRFKSKKPKSK